MGKMLKDTDALAEASTWLCVCFRDEYRLWLVWNWTDRCVQ